MKYGEAPKLIEELQIDQPGEFMHYLYMPIKLPDQQHLTLEPRIKHHFDVLLNVIISNFVSEYGISRFIRSYIYLTAKYAYCDHNRLLNRPGYHTDGFGTSDINYIWSNDGATNFLIGEVGEVSTDHDQSMIDMENAAIKEPLLKARYEAGDILRLTPYVIHEEAFGPSRYRMFVKVSFSDHFYDHEDNTRNYELKHPFGTRIRSIQRNDP